MPAVLLFLIFIILLLWIFRYCSLSSETLAVSLRKKVIQV